MIKIERLDCPLILETGLAPESEGEKEARDSISFYNDIANRYQKFKKTGAKGVRIEQGYTAYTDKSVRKVLWKMFRGKCAYCESKVTTIYSGDIEHFRPKSGHNNNLDEPLTKPGYYWLASEWKNLFLACPFCNTINTHEFTSDSGIQEIVLGKQNQFPLLSEAFRLNSLHGSQYFSDPISYKQAFELEETERVLINPCFDDNIEKFFKYDEEGTILMNNNLTEIERRKASISITVFALNRLTLTTARMEKAIQIKSQIKRVENAIKNFNTHGHESEGKKIWFEGILREEMRFLKKFTDPDQEYAGLARYFINQYLIKAQFT